MTQTSAPQTFSEKLYASQSQAIDAGQAAADRNGAPVTILARDGWYAVCEVCPLEMEPDPLEHGWVEMALIDPTGWDAIAIEVARSDR